MKRLITLLLTLLIVFSSCLIIKADDLEDTNDSDNKETEVTNNETSIDQKQQEDTYELIEDNEDTIENSNIEVTNEETSDEEFDEVITNIDDNELNFNSLETNIKVYRLYNPNSGEHFYTTNESERDSVYDSGWNMEGYGWLSPSTSNIPLYRLYNQNGGEHHYTTDINEKDTLVNLGWKYEGITCYTSDESSGIPIYRQYNPNAFSNNHNYTTDTNERDTLISLGWKDEGIVFYVCDSGSQEGSKTHPIRRTQPLLSDKEIMALAYEWQGNKFGNCSTIAYQFAIAIGTIDDNALYWSYNNMKEISEPYVGCWVKYVNPGHDATYLGDGKCLHGGYLGDNVKVTACELNWKEQRLVGYFDTLSGNVYE